jgi:hypothetical protein
MGPADNDCPVVRSLHDRFKISGRLVLFDAANAATPADKLRLLLAADPDCVFSFPGWTWNDNAELLWVLKQHGKLIFNTVGFAGLMHFPQAITATLVGSAVGPLQRASTTREALAVFDDGHSIGACYQPAQSHPFLDSETIGKSVARSKWGLPQEPSFIVVCVFKLDRLEPKSIPMFVRFLLKVPDSYIVFVERANGMRGQIIEWLNECDPNHPGIVDRFLFRPSTPNTKEFCTLLDGADASLDSLGNYSAHTTAGDAARRCVPHFSLNDPQGLMQSRVGAEVSIAAGLEQVCVGKTELDVIDLLVKYALDPVLPKRVVEYMAGNKKEKRGFYCTKRVPRGWMAALEFYRSQGRTNSEDQKHPDFIIPFQGEAAPVLIASPVTPVTSAVNEILGRLVQDLRANGNEMTNETEAQLSAMLQGISSETGVKYLAYAGSGTFMHTIRCRDSTGELVALKVSKSNRPADRMHNDPAVREAANLIAWQRRTKRTPVRLLLPEPRFLMAGGTSCLGTSKPDAKGFVYSFLLEEFVEGVALTDLVKEHRQLWQETGALTDKLRLEIFNTLSHGVSVLAHFGLYIGDIKFDNVILRTSGQHKGTISFIDNTLGHTFTRSMQYSEKDWDAGQKQPALLTRKCTSMALAQVDGPGARKLLPKNNLFLFGRQKQGQLIRCITRKEISAFLVRAEQTGLADLGAGADGFSLPFGLADLGAGADGFSEAKDKMKIARRKLVGSAARLRIFDRQWAFAKDLLAVHRMIFMLLTFRCPYSIAGWDAQLQAACKRGAAGLKEMLLNSLNPGVTVQQPMAFERLVDFFAGGLGPDKRCNAVENMVHVMNTLPILPPADEFTLASGGCIMMKDGVLRQAGHASVCFPAVSFALQSHKGIGVRAEQDIQPNTIIGPYAGTIVVNSEIGKPYISLTCPSRYNVVVTGDIPYLKLIDCHKITVDGQVTVSRDWDWVKINHNVGPYMNAPDDMDNDEVNCVLDRSSLWRDSSDVYLMWMKSCKYIRKGEFLHWKYNHKAGAGSSFRFLQKDE